MKLPAFAVATLATLLIALPAAAQKTQKPPKATPPQSSQAQVAGIVNTVVDGLWEASDHYWHEGDYYRIVNLLRLCVEADPSFNDAYSNAAYLLWSLGDTPGADAFFDYGITRTKDPGELNFDYGFHLFNTKRYEAAEPYLAKAVTYANAQPNWYAILGHCYRVQKKYDKSIQTWETVVEKFPKFSSGPVNLARVRRLKAESN